MMDWSDRHCRFLWRLLSPDALLFTEMLTAKAILHGDRDKLLAYDAAELPLVLQLGGSDPKELAQACEIAEQIGFSGIDLNCGCPSDRVQGGNIGAILMKDPTLVAKCFRAMQESCSLPISVKHRLGVDEQEEQSALCDFVSEVSDSGCTQFIVHARKAWLKGLSPKENRTVPPLNYELVYQLKEQNPNISIVINGGIESIDSIKHHLLKVDGVMIGRKIYNDPYSLQAINNAVFAGAQNAKSRLSIAKRYLSYIQESMEKDSSLRLNHLTRHALGLWHAQPGGRQFRRYLSEHAHKAKASWRVFEDALDLVG